MILNFQLTKTVLTLLISLTFCFANAQASECEIAKIGTFELVSPISGTTIIYRTLDKQTEINDSLNYEATFELRWINSCTYELRNKVLIKGDKRLAGLPTDVIKVEIIKIEGDMIFVKTSSNFNDKVLERILTKLK
jgi:hypothetical protein